MAGTLRFESDVGTIDFLDTNNFAVARGVWGPAVTTRRRSTLGGNGPYTDVTETMSINVRGTTVAQTYANLGSLTTVLDHAERWFDDRENLNPVVFKYEPQGSTLGTPGYALILGRAPGDETSMTNLPVTFDDTGLIFEMDDVQVQCVRRGLWTTSEHSGTSAATANPAKLLAEISRTDLDASIPCPMNIAFDGFNTTEITTIPRGYLVYTNDNTRLDFREAETNLSTAGFGTGTLSTVTDSGAQASGGTVARITTSGSLGVELVTSVNQQNRTKTYAAFAAVRNNSATTDWRITTSRTPNGGDTPFILVSVDTFLDDGGTAPQVIRLGEFSLQRPQSNTDILSLTIENLAGPSATLDIDYFVFVAVDDDGSDVIALNDTNVEGAGATFAMEVDSGYRDRRTPFVGANAINRASPYAGNAAITYVSPFDPSDSLNHEIVVMWLATNSAGGTDYWRVVDNQGTAISNALTATIYQAHLTPE